MSIPIRVLHVIGTMNRGGAESFVMELYRHIDRTKIQFDFLVYGAGKSHGAFDDEIVELGGKIYYAQKRLYREPVAYVKEVYNFAKAHQEYSIVHSHLNMRGGYILSAFKKAGTKLVIAHSHTAFPHTDIKNRAINWVGKMLLWRNVDFYFACSEEAMWAICGKKADNRSRFILHNAIDIDKYTFSITDRNTIRKEFGLGKETFVVMHIGRFTTEKNHAKTIEIFRSLTNKRPDSVLILVGQGDLLKDMRQYTNVLGLSDKVIFTGVRSDVDKLLSAGDVFLFPSMGEGLGIVLIEAQANGLPCVISSDVIPDMADVHAGLIYRVRLTESAETWADKCMKTSGRIESKTAIKHVKNAGYDINEVATWLQNFYLEQWL